MHPPDNNDISCSTSSQGRCVANARVLVRFYWPSAWGTRPFFNSSDLHSSTYITRLLAIFITNHSWDSVCHKFKLTVAIIVATKLDANKSLTFHLLIAPISGGPLVNYFDKLEE